MVANAIGVDSTRGDRLSVEAVAFEPVAKTAVDAAKPKAAPFDLVVAADQFSRPAVGLVAIVVLLVLALQVMKSGGRSASPATPATNGDGRAGELANGQSAELAVLRNRLQSGGLERTDLAAQVLRNWLTESQ